MNLGKTGQPIAFGFLVAYYVLAAPRGGDAQDPGCPICPMQPAKCTQANARAVYVTGANNPSITKNNGGGFSFTATSSLIWDCTSGMASACSLCADTTWFKTTTRTGAASPWKQLFASTKNALCGSVGNTANITDTLNVSTTDNLWYSFLFGFTDSAGGPCPGDDNDGTYTVYGSGSFQNN